MSTYVIDLWNELVGTYTPYVNAQTGAFATDWGYVACSVFVILVAIGCYKLIAQIIRGLFK